MFLAPFPELYKLCVGNTLMSMAAKPGTRFTCENCAKVKNKILVLLPESITFEIWRSQVHCDY